MGYLEAGADPGRTLMREPCATLARPLLFLGVSRRGTELSACAQAAVSLGGQGVGAAILWMYRLRVITIAWDLPTF
jgi:hypothetical protein